MVKPTGPFFCRYRLKTSSQGWTNSEWIKTNLSPTRRDQLRWFLRDLFFGSEVLGFTLILVEIWYKLRYLNQNWGWTNWYKPYKHLMTIGWQSITGIGWKEVQLSAPIFLWKSPGEEASIGWVLGFDQPRIISCANHSRQQKDGCK